jgi:Fe-S cluster biosynthesis and repair protein YggX
MSDATPRTVMCSRLGEELPGIAGHISFAGAFGERIRAHISQRAWDEWWPMQIKVLNEYRLHMGEAEHRKIIAEFAARFFCFDGGDGSLGPGPEGGLTDDAEGDLTDDAEGDLTDDAEGDPTDDAEGDLTDDAEGGVTDDAEGDVS